MGRRKTEAERRSDSAEDRAIAHSRHYHANMSAMDRYISEASRRDQAERRLEAQLRYGRTRRRRTSQRPKWTGRAR